MTVTILVASVVQSTLLLTERKTQEQFALKTFIADIETNLIRAAWQVNKESILTTLRAIVAQPAAQASKYTDTSMSLEAFANRKSVDWNQCESVEKYDLSNETVSGQALGSGLLEVCYVPDVKADSNFVIALLKDILPICLSAVASALMITFILTRILIRPLGMLSTHLAEKKPIEDFERPKGYLIEPADELGLLIAELNSTRVAMHRERSVADVFFPEVEDAMVETDQHHVILRHNRALEALLNIPIITGETNLNAVLKNHDIDLQSLENQELNWMNFLLELRTKKIFVKNKLQGYIHVIRDQTERQSIQEREMHNQTMASLGAIASGVAHDFNNILAAILGNAELIKLDSQLSGNTLKAADTIVESSQRGASLSNQMLSFARKKKLQRSSVLARMPVINTIKVAEPLIGKRVKLTATTQSNMSIYVDQGLLESALLNLIINAREALPNGGNIAVSCRSQTRFNRDYIEYQIRDDGLGIEENLLSKIRDPFFTTKSTGTGLGLAMVNGFIERSSGFMEIDSTLGQGTRISLFLPAHATTSVQSTETSTTFGSHQHSKYEPNILLVEDESALRKVFTAVLLNAGMKVTSSDGLADIKDQNLVNSQYDLIICDAILNQNTVIDVAQHFSDNNNNAPILLITGNIPIQIELECRNYPILEKLEKPFTAAHLVARAKFHLQQQIEIRLSETTS